MWTMPKPFPTLIAALFVAVPAYGEDVTTFPSQPVRIIVSVPAGGGVDTVTRLVADKLRQRFNQPVVVENRGGQAGNFGAEIVFAAEPDGYTLMASQPAPLTVNALLYRKLNYDPAALVPVALMTTIPNALTVRPDIPARTAEEFIAYAKANPGKLNYASQGTGTTSHLTAELFQKLTGAKLVHIPYKGTAPALNDLIAGHVDTMFTEVASTLELHRAGKVRILAVAAPQRSPLFPDIPTLTEAGVASLVSSTWNAISAPPKTPPTRVALLNEAVVAALKSDDVAAHLRTLNVQTAAMSPSEAAAFIAADAARWADVIRSANIVPE
jgi:tripartite-type tricarboxylate transporter receptor subunit TctC